MKTLYLVRHAKSSWSQSGMADFDRPLNERGNRDKKTMGKRLFAKQIDIDLIISSSAKRTTQTTYGLANEINVDSNKIMFYDELYHAGVSAMLAVLCNTPNSANQIMMVAHNPGISSFCDYLCGYYTDFPTLAIAKINFAADSWEEISAATGSLEWYDYPKN